ncbi:hypothetical protein Sipo8835_34670 [Streptomyces ipomoeae]|uniref:Uncharacterized protein n=1 Tax=Streptomyces ipomoeae TaxID=103232 RepID=A0AAE8VX77_9ACTN|nr:hypothetical protein [Streptomyces ipomoeae]TQE23561.1 hypothetical protein Sipo8835_34670 [Streptomyces ipomoeae]TQE34632.1 hypothetical protein Sipo7851_17220 [Streptomyces ipomoeae]
MKYIVAGHQAVTATEFAELALGTPVELWLGVEGEPSEECAPCKNRAEGDRLCAVCAERAARLDAARDILADPEFASLPDDLVRLAARVVDDHPELFNVVPLARPAHRRPVRRGAAA